MSLISYSINVKRLYNNFQDVCQTHLHRLIQRVQAVGSDADQSRLAILHYELLDGIDTINYQKSRPRKQYIINKNNDQQEDKDEANQDIGEDDVEEDEDDDDDQNISNDVDLLSVKESSSTTKTNNNGGNNRSPIGRIIHHINMIESFLIEMNNIKTDAQKILSTTLSLNQNEIYKMNDRGINNVEVSLFDFIDFMCCTLTNYEQDFQMKQSIASDLTSASQLTFDILSNVILLWTHSPLINDSQLQNITSRMELHNAMNINS
ncbi:hypothetical protein DFA_00316 [Cavenderia fasciculata]|uniref:Uncharacterized protein n=1 Tax=Cavenderia fasciculata TaxID=261658 RepID=F4PY78_CACFS|nr:uncharacterized protein DFA_00316 [Cavenderia fasciculata]EGG19738.1 hypothetical protein DFA_00316 [Cavenderia fasciculata]|eukprot:XP_004358032.1 hypothetical protein DFA_00316 [Cavenderia fasciculata]